MEDKVRIEKVGKCECGRIVKAKIKDGNVVDLIIDETIKKDVEEVLGELKKVWGGEFSICMSF